VLLNCPAKINKPKKAKKSTKLNKKNKKFPDNTHQLFIPLCLLKLQHLNVPENPMLVLQGEGVQKTLAATGKILLDLCGRII